MQLGAEKLIEAVCKSKLMKKYSESCEALSCLSWSSLYCFCCFFHINLILTQKFFDDIHSIFVTFHRNNNKKSLDFS